MNPLDRTSRVPPPLATLPSGPRTARYWLEAKTQTDLHPTLLAGAGNLSERGVHLLALWVESCGCVYGFELRMVEDVVHLPAQLEFSHFAHREVLEDRNVPVVNSGATE